MKKSSSTNEILLFLEYLKAERNASSDTIRAYHQDLKDFHKFLKGKPINKKTTATFNAIGFVLLLGLMFVVTYSDIAKLFVR